MISQEIATAQSRAEAQAMRAGLKTIEGRVNGLKATMEQCLLGNAMPLSGLAVVDAKITEYVRTTGRVPDYCDIGIAVFYDVYDWHVRTQQPIRITRIAEQRMAIQFKFTQLVLRWENAPNYVGTPFDQ